MGRGNVELTPERIVRLEEDDPPRVVLLDQRRLPDEEVELACGSVAEVAEAIRVMAIRGAPAIGVAAAYGLALAALNGEDLAAAESLLAAARPTAVNLVWALEQLRAEPTPERARLLHREEVDRCRRMAAHAAELLGPGTRALTHCNAGGLAAAGIPHEVIADSAAAWLMARGEVDVVVTGADRIAANGDTANKIGTYSLAVLAAHHAIPLYVVAPSSSVDLAAATGAAIPIEERDPTEISSRFAARNPAFDVTPADLIAAIVTEDGVQRPPYAASLARVRVIA